MRTAQTLGFDDIRFAHAKDTVWHSLPLMPNMLMQNASCIAVLFKAYRPSAAAPDGLMALSAYYAASHFAYHAAKAFTAYLCGLGFGALHTSRLPAKAAALRTGGWLGDNGFYYHPTLGSLVCIQTVLIEGFLPDPPSESANLCLHCGACRRACPFGGVGCLERCVRRHSDALIPEDLRIGIYQLFGCELCQAACPLNPQQKGSPVSFSVDGLLTGQHTAALQKTAGALMARPRRIVSQAALFAANTKQQQFAPLIFNCAQNADEPVRTHALWAYQKLMQGAQT